MHGSLCRVIAELGKRFGPISSRNPLIFTRCDVVELISVPIATDEPGSEQDTYGPLAVVYAKRKPTDEEIRAMIVAGRLKTDQLPRFMYFSFEHGGLPDEQPYGALAERLILNRGRTAERMLDHAQGDAIITGFNSLEYPLSTAEMYRHLVEIKGRYNVPDLGKVIKPRTRRDRRRRPDRPQRRPPSDSGRHYHGEKEGESKPPEPS